MFGLLVRAATPAARCAESSIRLALASGSVREMLTNTGAKQGPGGRSSVSGITATVFGGYGFVGSYVVNRIANSGSQLVVPFRSTENHVQHIKQMGDLGQIILLNNFDIRDDAAVKRAISRSNVVINMVGQRTETMNFTYEEAHTDWPQRLAKCAPVVGIEDHFYSNLIYQISFGFLAPVIDGGVARLQPTYVPDVAEAVNQIILRPETKGKTFFLGGPEILTYREVYDLIQNTLRMTTDDTLHVPAWAAKAFYAPNDWARKFLPTMPFSNWTSSAGYVEEVVRDSVVPKGALGYADLDIKAQSVTDGLAIEPVRHYRVGGYRWGDMGKVAKDVPESIRKYYNIK
eukprot:gene15531-21620_t